MLSPVLVELDGEVGHVLQGLVGEGHVHVHVALAAGEGPTDLQPLGFDGGEPDLEDNITLTLSLQRLTLQRLPLHEGRLA